MKKKVVFAVFILLLILLGGIAFAVYRLNSSEKVETGSLDVSEIDINTQVIQDDEIDNDNIPNITTEVVLENLNYPWDMVMIDEERFFFNERENRIYFYDGKEKIELNTPEDTYVRGEGGMLGLAIDPDFDTNSYVYACFNSTLKTDDPTVVVARWTFDINEMSLNSRENLITDIPSNDSGRHSGCQLEFGPDGYLWVGTGDAAMSENPQSTDSLGGKILRIDRDGNPAPGNLDKPYDPRIYSFGHRNIQGLGFFRNPINEVVGISIEHGPDRDDEINPLLMGNFGWDPLPNYGEGVPMTDLEKYPDAVSSMWSSGYPTLATSGGTIINSEIWGAWDQAIVAAALKGSRILILEVNEELEVVRKTEILKNQYGRIRTVVFGKDENLYFLTSNREDEDKILRISVKE